MAQRERNHRPGRIFTYIDSDAYEFYDEVGVKLDRPNLSQGSKAVLGLLQIDSEVYRAQRSDIPNYLEKNKIYMSESDSKSNLKNLLRKRRPIIGKDKSK